MKYIYFNKMAHNHNKIILLLMIKNESKIIERCIGRALEHVDAICILDTGSTDNTVDVCRAYLDACGKPYKISVELFKNFGYNRTISFQKAQELCKELDWDDNNTYAMAVDADMIICPRGGFRDFKMTLPGYNAIQNNGTIKYYNMRFMRCNFDWKCVGVTHEYWGGDPTGKIPYDVFYIDDRNDGGCKSDKFERDIRLLTEDLKDNPENGRSYFYLAQSLKDNGNFKEAIQLYKKRIKIGGWYEEVWYSHYMIGKCYDHLGQPDKMEIWMNRAFKLHSTRAEPLYHLTRYFREKSDHYKAYHYYLKGKDIKFPDNDVLFIEHNTYAGLFDYENTILACYVNGKTKQDSLVDIVKYINTREFHMDNVWSNIHYYIEPLTSNIYKGEYTKLFFPSVDEYQVSSCSVIPYNDRLLMNTRYVNYSIDANGGYHMRSPDGNVKTKNGMVFLNGNYYPADDVSVMHEEPAKTYPSNIEGLEDVRLFYFNNKLHFSSSTKNLTDDGKIWIAVGEYNVNSEIMTNISLIEPPRPSDCEKNWIAVPEECGIAKKGQMNFIFGWNPLQIGAVSNTHGERKKLEIHTTHTTPRFFSHLRGSSNLFEYKGRYWCVTHFVRYTTPRVYYHCLVGFNRETLVPEYYSAPFCFRKLAIEYCLGFHIKHDKATFFFSQNDNEPGFITVPFENFRLLPVN